MNDFNTTNEGIKYFIASIPISRIRSLVKHIGNEFQVFSVSMKKGKVVNSRPTSTTKSEGADPIFNLLTLESDIMTDASKYDTSKYSVPVGRAISIIQEAMKLFIRNSRLLVDFAHFFGIRRKLRSANGTGSQTRDTEHENIKSSALFDTIVEEDYCNSSSDDSSDSTTSIEDIEIVCGGDDECIDAGENCEVDDIFGTKTVLTGEHRTVEQRKVAKVKVSKKKKEGCNDIEKLFSVGPIYEQLVDVFSLSSATLIISQVSFELNSVHCLPYIYTNFV